MHHVADTINATMEEYVSSRHFAEAHPISLTLWHRGESCDRVDHELDEGVFCLVCALQDIAIASPDEIVSENEDQCKWMKQYNAVNALRMVCPLFSVFPHF